MYKAEWRAEGGAAGNDETKEDHSLERREWVRRERARPGGTAQMLTKQPDISLKRWLR
jgi:hypothetical protein